MEIIDKFKEFYNQLSLAVDDAKSTLSHRISQIWKKKDKQGEIPDIKNLGDLKKRFRDLKKKRNEFLMLKTVEDMKTLQLSDEEAKESLESLKKIIKKYEKPFKKDIAFTQMMNYAKQCEKGLKAGFHWNHLQKWEIQDLVLRTQVVDKMIELGENIHFNVQGEPLFKITSPEGHQIHEKTAAEILEEDWHLLSDDLHLVRYTYGTEGFVPLPRASSVQELNERIQTLNEHFDRKFLDDVYRDFETLQMSEKNRFAVSLKLKEAIDKHKNGWNNGEAFSKELACWHLVKELGLTFRQYQENINEVYWLNKWGLLESMKENKYIIPMHQNGSLAIPGLSLYSSTHENIVYFNENAIQEAQFDDNESIYRLMEYLKTQTSIDLLRSVSLWVYKKNDPELVSMFKSVLESYNDKKVNVSSYTHWVKEMEKALKIDLPLRFLLVDDDDPVSLRLYDFLFNFHNIERMIEFGDKVKIEGNSVLFKSNMGDYSMDTPFELFLDQQGEFSNPIQYSKDGILLVNADTTFEPFKKTDSPPKKPTVEIVAADMEENRHLEFLAGHSFIRITNTDGNIYSLGAVPIDGKARIIGPDFCEFFPKRKEIAAVYELKGKEEFENLMKFTMNYRKDQKIEKDYNALLHNCSVFAENVRTLIEKEGAEKIGVKNKEGKIISYSYTDTTVLKIKSVFLHAVAKGVKSAVKFRKREYDDFLTKNIQIITDKNDEKILFPVDVAIKNLSK